MNDFIYKIIYSQNMILFTRCCMLGIEEKKNETKKFQFLITGFSNDLYRIYI